MMRLRLLFTAATLALPALAQMEVTASAERGEPVILTFKQPPLPLHTVTGLPYSAVDTLESTRIFAARAGFSFAFGGALRAMRHSPEDAASNWRNTRRPERVFIAFGGPRAHEALPCASRRC
jgi:hypothetical protein